MRSYRFSRIIGMFACLVVVGVICAGILLFWIPGRKIAKYDKAFTVLQKGSTKQQVLDVMGKPAWIGGVATEFWNEEKLGRDEAGRITETLDYSVKTFYLPVTFRLSFDTNGLLVGKHRYD